MSADQTYFAVPALTRFTLVRSRLPVTARYANASGQEFSRGETGGRSFRAELTTFKPIIAIVNDQPTIKGYLDLGVDEFKYLGEHTEEDGDEPTPMDTLLNPDVISAMKNVLIEVMSESIPDFASQSSDMQAIGVRRFFNVDRIEFFGRDDQAKAAYLKVLLGVYGDADCTDFKTFVQQDFASSAKLAELSKVISDGRTSVTTATAKLTELTTLIEDTETTLEARERAQNERSVLRNEVERVSTNIKAAQAELDQLQPLSLVFNKPALAAVVKELTEALLLDAKANKPPYKDLNVDALLSRFDGAFSALSEAVSKV